MNFIIDSFLAYVGADAEHSTRSLKKTRTPRDQFQNKRAKVHDFLEEKNKKFVYTHSKINEHIR